jgi:hypothetical protein
LWTLVSFIRCLNLVDYKIFNSQWLYVGKRGFDQRGLARADIDVASGWTPRGVQLASADTAAISLRCAFRTSLRSSVLACLLSSLYLAAYAVLVSILLGALNDMQPRTLGSLLRTLTPDPSRPPLPVVRLFRLDACEDRAGVPTLGGCHRACGSTHRLSALWLARLNLRAKHVAHPHPPFSVDPLRAHSPPCEVFILYACYSGKHHR